jgi:hypothetical protein
MNQNTITTFWRPKYPLTEGNKVELDDCELQTQILDKHPGITVIDYQLDSPACFWTDPEHVYLRVNWGQWCTVSMSNPDQVAALRAAPFCHVINSVDNVIKDVTAPVYHISELPRELFYEYSGEVTVPLAEPSKKYKAISSLSKRIPDDIDAMGFKQITFEGLTMDLYVSSDDVAIIFSVYPDDEDYLACPRDDEEESLRGIEKGISATKMDLLVKQREILHEIETASDLHLAIIASSQTLASMRKVWADELKEKQIELVEYPEYEELLRRYFPKEENIPPED